MLTSDQIHVMGINFVSDEMVEMRYQYKEEFVEESGSVILKSSLTVLTSSLLLMTMSFIVSKLMVNAFL
jgi:hypothetical protein